MKITKSAVKKEFENGEVGFGHLVIELLSDPRSKLKVNYSIVENGFRCDIKSEFRFA